MEMQLFFHNRKHGFGGERQRDSPQEKPISVSLSEKQKKKLSRFDLVSF